ncbi:MAG: hypothetical protein IJ167_10065 [Lachnospiraceae bacterium]|nr:hypothetical protein [Lachnospiraceae bacterium]
MNNWIDLTNFAIAVCGFIVTVLGLSLIIISWLIWSIYFAILIITQFTKCIYYITDDNIYHRGKLYPLLLVPLVVLSLYIMQKEENARQRASINVLEMRPHFRIPPLTLNQIK